jgi:transposase
MEAMDWVACVGVDWGDKQHAYEIVGRDGARVTGVMGSSAEDVHEWVRAVRGRFPEGTIVVAVEQGRGSLLYALMAYDYLALVPINPRASKAYRESLRLSGASSDPSDAALICEFAMKHLSRLRVWHPDDVLTRKLRILAETRRTLVDQRTGLTHTLAASLKEYYPQALQWFGGEKSVSLRAFIMRWPTLEQMLETTEQEITEVMRSLRLKKISAKVKELIGKIQSAVPLTRDTAIIEAYSMQALALIAIIGPLDAEITKYDKACAATWAIHPERELFDSLPGAGPVFAPRLAVAFGTDRNRYQSANEIQCYSGIAPVTEKSGKQCWIHSRWGFPTFLHQTFHEFAAASMPHSAWAKAFYEQQRERGAGRHEAIRSLAFRWIRILFALWKDGEEYDEKQYIDALKRKHSPLVERLAAA